MSSKVFFFCGPHCSGKTTILKKLTDDKILDSWGNEIGKDLFYNRKLSTEEQGQSFEYEVTNLELSRDYTLSKNVGKVGIETWHPGNLAYAAVRNPSCVDSLCAKMIESPLLSEAVGIRFTVSPENIYTRTKTFSKDRKWAVEFYGKIDNVLDLCIKKLCLQERTFRVCADQPFDMVYDNVIKIIKSF